MRYSFETRDIWNRIWIFSFAKNIGNNLSNKYSKNLSIVLKNLQQMQ